MKRDDRSWCPQCGEQAHSISDGNYPTFYQCNDCGLIFHVPFHDDKLLTDLYKLSWKEPDASLSEAGSTFSNFSDAVRSQLFNGTGRSDFSSLRFLYFGAGRGSMSRVLRKRSADGIMVDLFGVDNLCQSGLTAAYAKFDDLPRGLSFDGIVALRVVELTAAGKAFAKLYSRLLRPAGWLVITTRNPNGVSARGAGGRWREAAKAGIGGWFAAQTLSALRWVRGCSGVRRMRRVFRRPGLSGASVLIHYIPQSLLLDGGLRLFGHKMQA